VGRHAKYSPHHHFSNDSFPFPAINHNPVAPRAGLPPMSWLMNTVTQVCTSVVISARGCKLDADCTHRVHSGFRSRIMNARFRSTARGQSPGNALAGGLPPENSCGVIGFTPSCPHPTSPQNRPPHLAGGPGARGIEFADDAAPVPSADLFAQSSPDVARVTLYGSLKHHPANIPIARRARFAPTIIAKQAPLELPPLPC